jgi:hypothetical protein
MFNSGQKWDAPNILPVGKYKHIFSNKVKFSAPSNAAIELHDY